MIDIRIKESGEILDLAPDAMFQIDYENPMFADDRCPLAFSTEISFLPTWKNKELLGFVSAMMLLPSVKELDVEVYASGLKILEGMLRFSSLKGKMINYTFIGRSVEDDWSTKIYEKQIYFIPGQSYEQGEHLQLIHEGGVDGVYAPLLINDSEADKMTFYESSSTTEQLDCSVEIKYHNYPPPLPSRDFRVFTPAITVTKILESELENITISSASIAQMLSQTAVLGIYKTDFSFMGVGGIPVSGLDVARTLPDVTALDLLRILMKMFCLALFSDADKFTLINVSEILSEEYNILDWENKISRDAEILEVRTGGYKFSYANGADENFSAKEGYTDIDSYEEMFDLVWSEDDYYAFRHSGNGNIISVRKMLVDLGETENTVATICDLLTANPKDYNFPQEGDGEILDNSVEAKLVRCVPDKLLRAEGPVYRMATIINPETVRDERGTDVIIGKIEGGPYGYQIDDGSVTFIEESEQINPQEGRLTAEALYECYHKGFSEWNQKPHQIVNSELKLSVADISSIRMWQKVSFSGKTWLIKKLTMTFFAASGSVDTTGEFVSVD